ncbi:MAG TPA: LEA type 2 family protein, partial [Myxococcota bacterium]
MSMHRRELLRTSLITSAAVPLALSTTGCATLMDLLGNLVKAPDISLKSFKITDATMSAFSVSLVALIKNPNPFGFRLDGLDWIVNLANGQAAKGKSPKGLALKARGSSETTLDIDFDIGRTASAILELIEKRKVPLGIEAVGHMRADKYKFDVPARYETSLPMPQIPDFDVPKFSVKKADLSGIRFAVEPLIKNSNGFDLDVDRFDFDVKIAGREVLKNKSIKNLKIASKKSERVPFEFDVDLAELGLTVAKIASNPRFDWQVG